MNMLNPIVMTVMLTFLPVFGRKCTFAGTVCHCTVGVAPYITEIPAFIRVDGLLLYQPLDHRRRDLPGSHQISIYPAPFSVIPFGQLQRHLFFGLRRFPLAGFRPRRVLSGLLKVWSADSAVAASLCAGDELATGSPGAAGLCVQADNASTIISVPERIAGIRQ